MSSPNNNNDNNVAWYELQFDTSFVGGNTTTVTFTLECYQDWAPTSFERFQHLVETGFLQPQFLVRAIPDFVLDWNYGPTGGNTSTREWQEYQALEWFRPNDDEVSKNSTPQSNKMGTIVFGQEDDGRTKTEVFINTQDNARLDKLGFWPFGKIVKTIIATTNHMVDADHTPTIQTLTTTDASWRKAVQDALCMQYGDVFFCRRRRREKSGSETIAAHCGRQ